MKKALLFLTISILFSSCEEEIVFEYTTTSISSTDFELCAYDQCPKLSLNYVELDSPQNLLKEVNKMVEALILKHLTSPGQTAKSINEAVEFYLSNSQNSYPETNSVLND